MNATFGVYDCVGGKLKVKEKLREAEYFLLSFLGASDNLSKEQKIMWPEGMM